MKKNFIQIGNRRIPLTEKLDLSHLNIKDLSEISGWENVKNIRSLNLSHNHISSMDLKYLSFVKNLEEIVLVNNELEDISWLSSCPNVRRVNLSFNFIEKIPDLSDLNKLEQLILSNNFIENIEGLENLRNLKILDLSYNSISELRGLEGLDNLIKLKIDGNPLEPDLIQMLGGLDELGYAREPKKWVMYCKVKKSGNDLIGFL